MKAVVLVAGYATRLYPLTLDRPKALLTLNGKALLEYLFDKIDKVDVIDEVILVSNDKFYTQFVEFATLQANRRYKITVLNDNTKTNEDRLGAIGDIEYAIEKCNINEEMMVLVSDNYFTFELKDFYDFYKLRNNDCVLGTTFEDLDYLSHNFLVAKLDENQRLIKAVEKPGYAFSNIGIYASYIYKKETIPTFKKYLDDGNPKDAPGNFPCWLMNKKPVSTYLFKGECYDIGTIEVYNKLNKMISKDEE